MLLPYYRCHFLTGLLAASLFFSIACSTPVTLIPSAEPPPRMVKKQTRTGKWLSLIPLVEGEMNLYYQMISIEEANLYNPFFPEEYPKTVPEHYIGNELLWRIDQWNYEAVVKQVMPDVPHLLKQLGRQGFRFENLHQMVLFYNDKKRGATAQCCTPRFNQNKTK